MFEINLFLGSAVIYLVLGGFLTYQAGSALGGSSSAVFLRRVPWLIASLFPLALAAGQVQANDPGRAPWLFPVVNLVVVGVPSLLIASVAVTRYMGRNPVAWPVTWREATSGFSWGAIGATSLGGLVNTAYLLAAGALLIANAGRGDVFNPDNLRTLPEAWGVAFDLSVLSAVAPLNEEFWKGLIVGLFFFRHGGLARCFCWGVLAGAGFNLLETFVNSLVAVNPHQLADQTIGGQWWLFGVARAGTGAIHALASGLAALGFYGLFRRRWSLLPLFLAGVLLHAAWNALSYLVAGDAVLSSSAPDAQWLDITGIAALVALGLASLGTTWWLSGRLRDQSPAAIYRLLGMVPARWAAPRDASFLLREAAGA